MEQAPLVATIGHAAPRAEVWCPRWNRQSTFFKLRLFCVTRWEHQIGKEPHCCWKALSLREYRSVLNHRSVLFWHYQLVGAHARYPWKDDQKVDMSHIKEGRYFRRQLRHSVTEKWVSPGAPGVGKWRRSCNVSGNVRGSWTVFKQAVKHGA